MSSFDTGYTVTASYVTAASDLFAYGVDLAFNQTEATGKIGVFEDKVTLSTLGLEALIYIQPKDAKVQPFVGAGIGLYVNNLNAKLNNVEYFDDSGSGFGFVGKAGLRLFLDNKFYIGGYGKYYSNDQDFENYDKSKTTHNLGGTCFVFEIGLKL
ncbi:outer membrane protein with beta-barrel domain [Desulfobotulus alkaliphilus]|uniref:Outer membrane protein with beta-barrel domain n=2 Tax=Desulfobotulus alkaliphilus TaxID=622671 RepID=A0A562RYE1_9BACT|nr:outer membrane protein with beta-barrel domain [Desulfobotulus alkaliphilus]